MNTNQDLLKVIKKLDKTKPVFYDLNKTDTQILSILLILKEQEIITYKVVADSLIEVTLSDNIWFNILDDGERVIYDDLDNFKEAENIIDNPNESLCSRTHYSFNELFSDHIGYEFISNNYEMELIIELHNDLIDKPNILFYKNFTYYEAN